MFSGKTEELIRRMKRAQIANKRVEIFKPHIDTRYHETDVVSHDSNSIRSTPVTHSENILLFTEGVEVAGIDEAHFSYRTTSDVSRVLLGEKEIYEPRCRICYYQGKAVK